jgi:phage baseplate assembly protein W
MTSLPIIPPRRDFAYPLRIDVGSQQAAQSPYAPHVEQMIEQILLTSPGERVDLPQFGCGLRRLVFAPMTAGLDASLKIQVTQALGRWLAGIIDVTSVDVATSDTNAALEPGTVQVTVSYTLIDTQGSEQTSVTLV